MNREAAADAGHFTTMQLRGGQVQGRDWHLMRLVLASRELYGGDPGKGEILRRMREALLPAGSWNGDCTLRVRVLPPHSGYRSSAMPGHRDTRLRIEVELEPPRDPPASPLRVGSHPGLRVFPRVKHLATAFQSGARAQAQAAGFDDALFVDAEGLVSEGTFWNIAFRDEAGIVWPEAPMLDGVTQRLLQNALQDAGVPQRRTAVRLAELPAMRAAFALNSRGVQDIAAVDGCLFPGDGHMSARLRELLAAVPRQHP